MEPRLKAGVCLDIIVYRVAKMTEAPQRRRAMFVTAEETRSLFLFETVLWQSVVVERWWKTVPYCAPIQQNSAVWSTLTTGMQRSSRFVTQRITNTVKQTGHVFMVVVVNHYQSRTQFNSATLCVAIVVIQRVESNDDLHTTRTLADPASRSVQAFLQGSLLWQTDRQTDHASLLGL